MKPPEEERKTSKKDLLIRDFVEARDEVKGAIHGLSDEDMITPMNEGGMTVKKLLIHWISWDQHEINRAGQYFAKNIPNEDISFWADEHQDEFNGQSFLKWENKSLEEVRQAFYDTTRRIEKYLKGFDEKQLFSDARRLRFTEVKPDGETVEYVVNPAWFLVEADHDRNHAREIVAWGERSGR